MRYGENHWPRFLGWGRKGPEKAARRSRALRPGGPDVGLEDRQLMTLQVVPVPAPSVALTSQDLTLGPDGNVWFTEPGIGKVGDMTPAGAVHEFALPPGYNASGGITAGPDGNVWFTETNAIGRITPTGTVTEFPVAPNANITGITAGPDGNLWFTNTANQEIGRITPTGAITEFPVPGVTNLKSAGVVNFFNDITAGPDGNVWFTAEAVNPRTTLQIGEVGRVTPTGNVTMFRLPVSRPSRSGAKPVVYLADAITAGPDGNLWFTAHAPYGPSTVGRITPQGKINQFAIPAMPFGSKVPDISTSITAGPDGNLYFNLVSDNFLNGPFESPYIGRVTPRGGVSVYGIPQARTLQANLLADGADAIINGPGNRLWFTSSTHDFLSQTGRVIANVLPPTTVGYT